MASIKDLKKRIGSVKNTQQTTKAMKMVSAAKLRRAQDAIINQRPYAREVGAMIQKVAALSEGRVDSQFFAKPAEDGKKPRVLLLVVSSDRGLCAAFNSNVIKTAQRWIRDNASQCESITLTYLGKRGFDFLKGKHPHQGEYYAELGGKVTFAKAKKLSDALVAKYLAGEFDEIKVVYNEFKNAVLQLTRVENFLPVNAAVASENTSQSEGAVGAVIVKPDLNEVMNTLIEKNFSIQIFRFMLESQAGEHGARMSAMENATKNASEMIRKLTLQYNKQRQANITKELLEIISGSESQKSA